MIINPAAHTFGFKFPASKKMICKLNGRFAAVLYSLVLDSINPNKQESENGR